MLRLSVPADRSAALAAALGALPPMDEEPATFLCAVGPIVAGALPGGVVDGLRLLASGGGTAAAAHVTGLLSCDERPPPTPDHAGPPRGAPGSAFDGAVLGIALLLGEPVSYAAEKGGVLVQNVFPIRSEETSPSNEGSTISLGLHTELVFDRNEPQRPLDADSPDFLVLSCLRPDPHHRAVTFLVENRSLWDRLAPRHRDALRTPRFELRAPYSFTRDGDGSRPWVGPTAIATGDDDDPHLALDLACGTRALDGEAGDALDALQAAAGSPGVVSEIRLATGDLLVIDNRRCLHGRSSFAPAYDGRDRWLQRVYVRRSPCPEGTG